MADAFNKVKKMLENIDVSKNVKIQGSPNIVVGNIVESEIITQGIVVSLESSGRDAYIKATNEVTLSPGNYNKLILGGDTTKQAYDKLVGGVSSIIAPIIENSKITTNVKGNNYIGEIISSKLEVSLLEDNYIDSMREIQHIQDKKAIVSNNIITGIYEKNVLSSDMIGNTITAKMSGNTIKIPLLSETIAVERLGENLIGQKSSKNILDNTIISEQKLASGPYKGARDAYLFDVKDDNNNLLDYVVESAENRMVIGTGASGSMSLSTSTSATKVITMKVAGMEDPVATLELQAGSEGNIEIKTFDGALVLPVTSGLISSSVTTPKAGMIKYSEIEGIKYHNGSDWLEIGAENSKAGNGLTLTGSTMSLGGTLTQNTTIDVGDYIFDMKYGDDNPFIEFRPPGKLAPAIYLGMSSEGFGDHTDKAVENIFIGSGSTSSNSITRLAAMGNSNGFNGSLISKIDVISDPDNGMQINHRINGLESDFDFSMGVDLDLGYRKVGYHNNGNNILFNVTDTHNSIVTRTISATSGVVGFRRALLKISVTAQPSNAALGGVYNKVFYESYEYIEGTGVMTKLFSDVILENNTFGGNLGLSASVVNNKIEVVSDSDGNGNIVWDVNFEIQT